MDKSIGLSNYFVFEFCTHLREEEKSQATIEKYERDVRKFLAFVAQNSHSIDELSKEIVLEYKEKLLAEYEVNSVNSMLAATNNYLRFIGKRECSVRQMKIQRKVFLEEGKCISVEEAKKILLTAEKNGKIRTQIMIETICSTGIRVSELAFFTVKKIKKGIIQIHNKGKFRVIMLTKELRNKLLRYARMQSIVQGPIFITRTGGVVDRSNFWKEIKEICKVAGVKLTKGFPHNFRHLFARCFYEVDKDIVNLAAVLGHSNIETTRIYTMVSYVNIAQQLDKLRSVFKE